MHLRRLLSPRVTTATLALFLCIHAAWGAFPTLYLKPVCLNQIHAPTNIVSLGDGSGRLFVCDQPGRIYIIRANMLLPVPFLDVSSKLVPINTGYSERGLLGLAFHPDYTNPSSPGYRKFYVNYSAPNQPAPGGSDPASTTANPIDHKSILAEYQVSATDPNVADPGSERILMTIYEPQSNHNGGQLEFGTDGYLYFGTGDGGNSNDNNYGHTGGTSGKPNGVLGNSQDRTNLLGKILRIDPAGTNGPNGQYGIPASNPFVGAGAGVRSEIYAFGLRNPWRFCFDKRAGGTGRMFCGDVGQGRVEEVNIIVAGGNYGWRIKEGSLDHDATAPNPSGITPTPPIAEYAHPGASGIGGMPQLGLSITGGYIYRGEAIPALQGKYVFGDYGATSGSASGRMMGLEETAPGSGVFTLTQTLPLVGGNPLASRILCLGEDENGEFYVGTKITGGVTALENGLPNGGIYKITAPPATENLTLDAARDNSMFSEDGTLSNGTGNLFAGRIANGIGYLRRALLGFDLSAVPQFANITSATVQMNVNLIAMNGPEATNMRLHRTSQQWGEGTSSGVGTGAQATANDATWTHRFWDATPWSTAGGTFVSTASATRSVHFPGSYTWTSAQLAQDVNGWKASPSNNFGWVLLGDEATDGSAKRFDSRESPLAVRPKLTVTYVPPTRFEIWQATHLPSTFKGQFVDPDADDDGDNIPNQVEYAYGFSPTTRDNPADALGVITAPSGGGATTLTASFRRDPSAIDLVYLLQTSGDLINWITIAESADGATASGSGFVSDTEISGQAPYRRVVASVVVPADPNQRHFVRLQVLRNP